MMPLTDVPEEVLYRVFEKLCVEDRINAQVVDKRFASILKPPSSLWRDVDIALTDNPQVLTWFAEHAPSVASLSLSQRCPWSVYHLRTSILAIAASQTLCRLEELSVDRTGSEAGIFSSACLQIHLTKLELLNVSFTDLHPKCINQLSKLHNLRSLCIERDASEAVHGPPSHDQATALWQAIGSLEGLTSLRLCSLDLELDEEAYDMGYQASIPISQLRNLSNLHLERCRFVTLPAGFGNLMQLKSLHLHEELTRFEILHDLTALTHLHLAVRSPFYDLTLPKGLQSLSLSAENDGSRSTSGMNMALEQLLRHAPPSLTSLRLRRFELTDVLPLLLNNRLLNLDVRNNEIAHLPIGRYLHDLESLVNGPEDVLTFSRGRERFSGDDLARLRRLCDAGLERDRNRTA